MDFLDQISEDSLKVEIERSDADAWVIHDFRGSNQAFRNIFPQAATSRRAFLLVPSVGKPSLLVSAVDADKFPGVERVVYASHEDLVGRLTALAALYPRILMEYSPNGLLPVISCLDAGTYELLRGVGFEIRSSADLHQRMFARWSAQDLEDHRYAADVYMRSLQAAFRYIRENLGKVREGDVFDFLHEQVAREGVELGVPCVAVNEHSGMPHYELQRPGHLIGEGDWVFIDCHARLPGKVYADITWVGYVGKDPPERYRAAFQAVREARDLAVEAVRNAYRQERRIEGWQLDRIARDHLGGLGHGAYFTHRLGHSLGRDIHGPGANLDDFECRDTRALIPGTAFTVEPGLYFPDFGVRSEINVYLEASGPRVLTPLQMQIETI